jgi:hypothetical protein
VRPSSQYFIDKLKLQKHPEGGYFSETYRSQETVPAEALPEPFKGDRNISTAIYFLLEGHQFSAFHRIKSDELWHFYSGIPLNVFIIHPHGELEVMKIGDQLEDGCSFQGSVKAGCWFASKPINTEGFSLVGCTVAPGFDFEDFELAGPELAKQYPQHSKLILELIR